MSNKYDKEVDGKCDLDDKGGLDPLQLVFHVLNNQSWSIGEYLNTMPLELRLRFSELLEELKEGGIIVY